jgi:alpha-N-arabinofuranosidase
MKNMLTTRTCIAFGQTQLKVPPKSTDLGNSSGGALAQAGMRLMIALAASALGAAAPAREAAAVRYKVDPSKVENTVDVKIYGQFLEHIFNSVHGGLWGDMILNPSLESHSGGGWVIEDNTVMSSRQITDRKLIFGDAKWGDYELTLEARKIEGAEGFLVMFRVADPGRFYWANIGGWGNREHAFQKNGGAMGKHVAGTIEKGKWYKVRVRCEGARIQAFLDGQLVLDETDAGGPILEGGVGLNGWNTQVQFRNIKVADLGGKTLFEGLPPRNALASAPAYWQFFGDAGFSNETGDAFNNSTSLRIRTRQPADESGIRQMPMMVRKGERYTGSLYLKGSAAAGVTVRMVDEAGKQVFARNLRDIGPIWKKQDFEFTAGRTVGNATFEVALTGSGDVTLDMINLFPQSALQNGGFRPDVLQAIKDLKPATIRYPGGCFASAYRWKDGIGPRENRTYFPNVIWDDQDPNQMGTDEFMDLCQRVGAEPILPVNMNLSVQDALDWLEYCNGDTSTKWGAARAKNGHPEPYQVKLWEIDNETWGMGPERYAEVVSKFSRALRGKDPAVKIIACGGYGYDDGKGSSNGWNAKLLDKCARDFDYLSIHYYNGIMYEQDFIEDPRRYEAYMRDDIGKLIQDSANPAIRIYCSEWGMMNDEWRSGLYTGGILNGFERQSELVPMTCPAVWLQTVTASRPRPRWTSCLILFDHQTCYGAPTWVVEKLWREHYAPKRIKLEGPEQPLNSVATLSEDGRTLYLKSVNPTKQAVTINLAVPAAFARAKPELLVVSGQENDRNSLTEPNKLGPQTQQVTAPAAGVFQCTMPPLSAGVLALTADKTK